MEAPILSIVGVTKKFGGLVAVNNLSIDVHEGEAVGLMGPNGAGKTTVINIISGQYKPDMGMVKFKGNKISGLPPHMFVEQNVRRSLSEAERAYILETGRIVLSGNVQDLREEEKVKKAYFGA